MFVLLQLDDLDFSPCSKQLVSIAKDGLLLVWNAKAGGAPQVKLTCPETHGGRYLFRRCR